MLVGTLCRGLSNVEHVTADTEAIEESGPEAHSGSCCINECAVQSHGTRQRQRQCVHQTIV